MQYIATRARKRLNIMKAISASSWGANSGILTMFYKAAILSILEYASPIYAITLPLEKTIPTVASTVIKRSKTSSYSKLYKTTRSDLLQVLSIPLPLRRCINKLILKPIHLRIQRSIMRYVHKVTQLPFDHLLKPII